MQQHEKWIECALSAPAVAADVFAQLPDGQERRGYVMHDGAWYGQDGAEMKTRPVAWREKNGEADSE